MRLAMPLTMTRKPLNMLREREAATAITMRQRMRERAEDYAFAYGAVNFSQGFE